MEFHIQKDSRGHFRWHLKAGNSDIVAESGEGYVNKQDAKDMINKIKLHASTSTIIDHTE